MGPTVCFVDNGVNLFAGTYHNGVFRSTDKGASWFSVNNGLMGAYVYSLAAPGTNVVAATDSGVFRSSDNGLSWNASSRGLGRDVYGLAVAGTNVLAAGDSGVFRLADDGVTWS